MPRPELDDLRVELAEVSSAQAVVDRLITALKVASIDDGEGNPARERTYGKDAEDLSYVLDHLPPEVKCLSSTFTIPVDTPDQTTNRPHFFKQLRAYLKALGSDSHQIIFKRPFLPQELESGASHGSEVRRHLEDRIIPLEFGKESGVYCFTINPKGRQGMTSFQDLNLLPYYIPVVMVDSLNLLTTETPLTPALERTSKRDQYKVVSAN